MYIMPTSNYSTYSTRAITRINPFITRSYAISDEDLIKMAREIIENRRPLRSLEKKYGYKKSTIDCNIHKRLPNLNIVFYTQCLSVFRRNYDEKHIHGGLATQKKYSEKLNI